MRLEGGLANIATLICAAAGMKKRDGSTFKPIDFMPHADQPPEQSFDDMANILMSLGKKADGE